MSNIFNDVIELGIEHDNHESDLYLPYTDEVKELLKKHNENGDLFKSQIDGNIWIDLPFQYLPFWQKRCK